MESFDPFGKPLASVKVDDLGAFQNVAEGWFVEYKRSAPSVPSIAKSISSFANHFGGWLLYGVAERDRLPESFPGISVSDAPTFEAQIRDAARTFIHPTPYFEVRTLAGPSPLLGLEAGRAIVIVRVPEGAAPPYIHGHGKIYRRVADASDPKAETDRSVLDLLYERSRVARKRLRRRLAYLPLLSQAEAEAPYVQLFLLPDPTQDQGFVSAITHEQFATEMKRSSEFGIPLETTYPSATGYVARQIGANDPYSRLLTWEFDLDGFCSVTLPIRTGDPQISPLYKHAAAFAAMLSGHLSARVLDLNLLLALLAACVEKYLQIAQLAGVPRPYFVKARVVNVWRRVPFIDTLSFLAAVEQYGIPVIQYQQAFAPPSLRGDTLLEITQPPANLDSQARTILRGLSPFARIIEALGVPLHAVGDIDKFQELLDATRRAIEVHRGEIGTSPS